MARTRQSEFDATNPREKSSNLQTSHGSATTSLGSLAGKHFPAVYLGDEKRTGRHEVARFLSTRCAEFPPYEHPLVLPQFKHL